MRGDPMSVFDVVNTPSGALQFTVDNTQDQLLYSAGPGFDTPFTNGNGSDVFADGDNLKLKSIRTIRPYQFGPGDYFPAPYRIGFKWRQNSVLKDIPELGTFGIVFLDRLCGDVTPNIKLASPDPGDGDFRLVLDFVDIAFSQINAPAILNGTIVNFGFQLELEHTISMST